MKMSESDYRRSKRVFQLLLHDGKNSTAVEKNEKVIKITHIVAVQELSTISIFLSNVWNIISSSLILFLFALWAVRVPRISKTSFSKAYTCLQREWKLHYS